MKTRRFTGVSFFIMTGTLFAASPAANEPVWLQLNGNPSPRSSAVFEAFTSKEPLERPAREHITPLNSHRIAIYPQEFRDIDGSTNNPRHLGSATLPHLRTTTIGYGDGVGSPAGADRLSAREISDLVCAQSDLIPNSQPITSWVWQWGQFVDHDTSLTRVANPAEPFNIPVPQGDPVFDPKGKGNVTLPFQRSASTIVDGVRQQINANTSFLDGSVVYGSDPARATALRALDGTGHLLSSPHNLLPFNTSRQPNQPDNSAGFFLAGDVRANENIGLTCLQVVFMREHNFWADTIKAANPTFSDDDIYLRARAIVGAEIQKITYVDFLPILLGPNALTPYVGYDATIDPQTALIYPTAAFRIGHTFLPPVLEQVNARGVDIQDLPLGAGFFRPALLAGSNSVDLYLRGLAAQVPQETDAYIIDAVRNFQIGGIRAQGFDLASLNIQRGRDHGIPSYNQVRIDYGLPPKASFADITSDMEVQARLASAYTSPDDMDVWVGGICEDHYNGGLLGETFFTILKDQFQRFRDGDRFWYEGYLDADTLALVQSQTLGAIIKRNTSIGSEMQDDVFHVASQQ